MLVVDGDERGDGVALGLLVGGEAEEEKNVLLNPAATSTQPVIPALLAQVCLAQVTIDRNFTLD